MKQDFKCFIGLHKYEVLKEENISLIGTDVIVAKTIVCRCSNCGKLKKEVINLTANTY